MARAGAGAGADLRHRRGRRRPARGPRAGPAGPSAASRLATADERADVALQLVGAHQATNAAAAAAAALAVGLPLRGRGRRRCAGVASLSKWRMELHELASGVVLLNDSYNANPESMRAAIDALVTIGEDPAVAPHGRRARRDARARRRQRGAPPRARRVRRRRGSTSSWSSARTRAASTTAPRAGARACSSTTTPRPIAWLREHLREGDAVLVKASRGRAPRRGRRRASVASEHMSQGKVRVALLFGGRSGEHAISAATAAGVLRAIDRDKYDVIPVGITREGRWVVASDDPAVWELRVGPAAGGDRGVRLGGRAVVLAPTDRSCRCSRPAPVPDGAQPGRRRLPRPARPVRRGRHRAGAARARRRPLRRLRRARLRGRHGQALHEARLRRRTACRSGRTSSSPRATGRSGARTCSPGSRSCGCRSSSSRPAPARRSASPGSTTSPTSSARSRTPRCTTPRCSSRRASRAARSSAPCWAGAATRRRGRRCPARSWSTTRRGVLRLRGQVHRRRHRPGSTSRPTCPTR